MKELVLRDYQKNILNVSRNYNTLVVLPTGLGKTYIALALVKEKLNYGKVIFLAPTKPLCVQHKKTFEEFGIIGKILTGEINSSSRNWNYKLIFCTPQTLRNDLLNNKLSLHDVSLIIFDEAHKAVGEYAYVFIANKYYEQNKQGRILALTASPGDNKSTILEICNNLHIEKIEYRSESSEDVVDYLKEKKWERVEVSLDDNIKKIITLLNTSLDNYLNRFNNLNLNFNLNQKKLSRKMLLNLQKIISNNISQNKSPVYYSAASVLASIIKIQYMQELVQSQSLGSFIYYFENLKTQKTKSAKQLINDENINKAYEYTKFLLNKGLEHPKFNKIINILLENKSKTIIFTNYVYTAKRLNEFLNQNNISSSIFIGQRKGLSQKQQIEIISKFKEGLFNVLISTSIGEEGLHIPSVDLGIFFEPVPSALRMIQRRGRVGRTSFGKILVLYTKGGIDEKYYWVAKLKHKRMNNAISYLSKWFNKNENNS